MSNKEDELKIIPVQKMSSESIEDALERIIEALEKKGIHARGEAKRLFQTDVYFDDITGVFDKAGKSLRIRIKDDSAKITYKEPVQSDTAYKQRKEYEIKINGTDGKTMGVEEVRSLLQERYPEVQLPEDLGEVLRVLNQRTKIEFECPDGSIIEMAFDNLRSRISNGEEFPLRPEIEFERKSGNSANLNTILGAIEETLPGRFSKNPLSKYARARKEIKEQRGVLSIQEVSACAILSRILGSVQYEKLREKGQILHDYSLPTTTNLDNFRDMDYLVDTVKRIKIGDYKFAIPEAIAQDEQMHKMLIESNVPFVTKKATTLEDIFCLLLSDTRYEIVERVVGDFLNNEYYKDENAKTNRMSHSQQVMIGAGIMCKRLEPKISFEEKLTCMISALSHDIGHVPYAHKLERILRTITGGIFSHEANGQTTLNDIYYDNDGRRQLIDQVSTYFPESMQDQIPFILRDKKDEIGRAIAQHSRKNSEGRGYGITEQAPRACDKIMYSMSDICDLLREQMKAKGIPKGKGIEAVRQVLSSDWEDRIIEEICTENSATHDEVLSVLGPQLLPFIRQGDFGNAALCVLNSIQAEGVKTQSGEEKVEYNANRFMWSFVEKIIDRARDLRNEMKIDTEKQKDFPRHAISILIDLLDDQYYKHGQDINGAIGETIKILTRMGEPDMLDYTYQNVLLGLSPEVLKGEVPPNAAQRKLIIEAMCNRAWPHHSKKSKEYLKEFNKLSALPPEELIRQFGSSKAFEKIEIEKIIELLAARSDIQLKVNPEKLDLPDMLDILEIYNAQVTRRKITDEYYPSHPKGTQIKIRREQGSKKQQLVVKVPVVKEGLSERINRTFKFEGDLGTPVEEMLEMFRKSFKETTVDLAGTEPTEVISIDRMVHECLWKGLPVFFAMDSFHGRDGRRHREIEISCPTDPQSVTEIKKALSKKRGKGIFFKASKLQRCQAGSKERRIRRAQSYGTMKISPGAKPEEKGRKPEEKGRNPGGEDK